MPEEERYDAVVVGAGPNGLAAAVELARAGRSVLVREGAETVGGGTRTDELTLPGFVHDVCSAIHPLALASPFFRTLGWERHGVEWVHAGAPLAHPLEDGTALVVERSVDETAATLGPDGEAYRKLVAPLVRNADALMEMFLGPVLRVPRHPLVAARFGLVAARSARGLAARFSGEGIRAALAGCAAHALLPLDRLPTGAFGAVFLVLAHAYGWPMARGGSAALTEALAAELEGLGGVIETNRPVASLNDLPDAEAVLFDVTPKQLVAICGDRLPARRRRRLARFRYGPAVFKVDWALDGPIPWKADGCGRAGTVHVGGTFQEIHEAESAVGRGEVPERPFIVLAQQTLFDPSRAPEGKHTVWGYCHVPNGCPVDMTERMEETIERFAPGFRDRILARHSRSPAALEADNPNYIGGDIAGGRVDLRGMLLRPTISADPYATGAGGIFLCSSSTPPGPGVHGMCGYHAARSALRYLE